jgi:hypothetical protein
MFADEDCRGAVEGVADPCDGEERGRNHATIQAIDSFTGGSSR